MTKGIWHKLNQLRLNGGQAILALAPMAGITDSPFRQVCKSFGADVVYTEMVSADGLAYKSKKTLEFLEFDKSERPVVLQLFGKNPENFKKAIVNCKLSASWRVANFDGIDINMGCPARKVVSSGHGVALMNNAKLAGEIVRAIKESTQLPVSVKARLGFKNKNEILSFGPKMEEAGADALCVHARTYSQGFSGPIDIEIIKKLKTKLKIPLIVNGGIYEAEDVKKILNKTKADGVMIARGALGKPWIFKEIAYKLREYRCQSCEYTNNNWNQIKPFGSSLKVSASPSWALLRKTALKHAALAYKFKGDYGIIEMRKHLAWYVRGLPNASELRQKLVRVETVEEIKEILK